MDEQKVAISAGFLNLVSFVPLSFAAHGVLLVDVNFHSLDIDPDSPEQRKTADDGVVRLMIFKSSIYFIGTRLGFERESLLLGLRGGVRRRVCLPSKMYP